MKATENVDDDWVKDVTAKGADGKRLLEEARALIKQYESEPRQASAHPGWLASHGRRLSRAMLPIQREPVDPLDSL